MYPIKTRILFWIMCCVLMCYINYSEASCLSYGHSCWGAHGKRSGPPHVKPDQEDTDSVLNNRWELIKIFKDKNDFYPVHKSIRKSVRVIRVPNNRRLREYIAIDPELLQDDSKQQYSEEVQSERPEKTLEQRPVVSINSLNNDDAVFDESLLNTDSHTHKILNDIDS